MDRFDVMSAIEKLAKGGPSEEISIEYGLDPEGVLRPVKKKEVKKDVMPDIRAIQILMQENDLSRMSVEELERERGWLKKALEENDEKDE